MKAAARGDSVIIGREHQPRWAQRGNLLEDLADCLAADPGDGHRAQGLMLYRFEPLPLARAHPVIDTGALDVPARAGQGGLAAVAGEGVGHETLTDQPDRQPAVVCADIGHR